MYKMKDWTNWPEEYYQSTDREERLEMLKERLESSEAEKKDEIRMEFWNLRYKQREKMPEGVDYFIRSWMDLYFVSKKPDSSWLHKQHVQSVEEAMDNMGFRLAEKFGAEGKEVLYDELCHGAQLYINLCRTDSKYTSQLIGLMKIKPDNLVEKIANELWKVCVNIPLYLGHRKEFALLERACTEMFWKTFPKYVIDQHIKLQRPE